jgi:hypothetical protein
VSRSPSKVRAWLEIMRISNAPTVVSNAIAGGVLGFYAKGGASSLDLLDARWIIILAPLCCYIGGMVLNDAFDARIDARERPERPIPSGRISRGAAFVVGALLLLGGIAFAAATGSMLATLATAVLAIAVLAYDTVHSYIAASVVLLAVCRALAAIIPMAAFAADAQTIASSGILAHPAALAVWTLILSILARGEVAAPRAPFPPCPWCGHPMLADANACSECGKKPNPAVAETRASQRALALGMSRLLLMPALAAAFMLFLPRSPVTFENFSGPMGPSLAMLVAIGLSVFLIFEARRRARGYIGTPQFVGFLIAVLAGIDAIALVNIGQPLALACAVCFIVTIVLQRRIAGS